MRPERTAAALATPVYPGRVSVLFASPHQRAPTSCHLRPRGKPPSCTRMTEPPHRDPAHNWREEGDPKGHSGLDTRAQASWATPSPGAGFWGGALQIFQTPNGAGTSCYLAPGDGGSLLWELGTLTSPKPQTQYARGRCIPLGEVTCTFAPRKRTDTLPRSAPWPSPQPREGLSFFFLIFFY